jgi:hypothetical protein
MFDCWVLTDYVQEYGSQTNLCQYFLDRNLLPLLILDEECVLSILRHDDVGLIVESVYQQLAKFIAYLAVVPLLAIRQCPVNTSFATA